MTDHEGADSVIDGGEVRGVRIMIDGLPFEVAASSLTGADLRQLAHPPISGDRDLWLEREHESDRLIGNVESVRLADGLRFFTVPIQISMG